MTTAQRRPRVPPRWFVRGAWAAHRGLVKASGGRLGLRRATPTRCGWLRLTTVGRRTGEQRQVVLGYLEDGSNLVLMAMNGWADEDPAWWLNLQANPVARVELPGEARTVRARAAREDERTRLWAEMVRVTPGDLDAYAGLRSRETALVVLEPVPADGSSAAG